MHVLVETDVTILASAVIVLGGLAALARSLLRFRDTVRDNTTATDGLTRRMDAITVRLDHDYAELAARVSRLEAGERLRCCAVVTVCQWLPKLTARHKPSCCLSSDRGAIALGFGGDARGLRPLNRQGIAAGGYVWRAAFCKAPAFMVYRSLLTL